MEGGRAVEVARAEARRRRHAFARPEHLLRGLLASGEIDEEILGRGVDPLELRERVDARLAAEDQVGGYRDGVDVAIAPELTRVATRLARRRWLGFAAAFSAYEALLFDRGVAELVFDLRRGNDFRHLLERGRALAAMRGHGTVEVHHLLRVLVDVRSFVATLERAGGDAAKMKGALDEALAARTSIELEKLPVFDAVVREALACGAKGAYAGEPPLSVRELCLRLAAADEGRASWTAAGILPSDFVRAVHVPEWDARRSR